MVCSRNDKLFKYGLSITKGQFTNDEIRVCIHGENLKFEKHLDSDEVDIIVNNVLKQGGRI